MSIHMEQIEGQDLTIFRVSGEVGAGEQLAAMQSFFETGPTGDVLWDFREVEGERYFYEDVKEVLDLCRNKSALRPPGKTAIVTAKPVDFGLARMAKSLSEAMELPWEVRNFTSMEEAVDWLGVHYP